MKKSKFTVTLIFAMLVALILFAVGCSPEKTTDENASAREVGFPSLTSVPAGFSYMEDKSVDMGDWCEIIYENTSGDILSLDCYAKGTFDLSFLPGYAALEKKITINNVEASIYNSDSDNAKILVWEDAGNNALCVLGGNISEDELIEAAKNVRYDMKKDVKMPEKDEITTYSKADGTADESELKNLSHVLDYSTKPLFDSAMENDKAISEINLESIYKSFDFPAADGLSVEVFDYEYIMKVGESVVMTGGMVIENDGNITGFNGSSGQLAALSRRGEIVKAVPLVNLDVNLEPDGADHETSEWIVENVMISVKSPACIKRNRLYN